MDLFTAASHHDVLVLVVQIAVLLFTVRALGEIAQRLGQPSVVGEILAGIVLGPSLLSSLFPVVGEWIVPQTAVQGYLLEVISLIGAIFLLLITGLETDLSLIRRHARTAVGVSFGGIIVTFLTGFLLGQYLPDFLLADPSQRLVFALFVATAMSISAIPVIAKVLMDLNLMRRDIGQTIIASGMSDDTIGWILLSIVVGLASGEAISAGSVLQIVGSVLAFMVLSFTLGRWFVKKALDFVQDGVVSRDRLLTLVIVLTFAWGAITQALNLETLGWIMQQVLEWGFLAIIIIFQPELRRALEQLGRGKLFSSSTLNEESERNRLIEAMSKSVSYMAKRRIGALISIERETGLSEYIETGIPMNSDITSELMINLFIPNTPLHDGAVIVQKNRIAAAACYLPLSESPFISKELGTRHRAALGISEVTDAITIVVSEETGAISLTANGDLHRNLSLEDFEVKLRRIWFGVEQQQTASSWWNWRGEKNG